MRIILTLLFLCTQLGMCLAEVSSSSRMPTLFEQLVSEDRGNWILDAEALDYMGKHRVVEAIPVIKKILENKKNHEWLRGRAFQALVKIQNSKLESFVKEYAKDPHSQVRASLAETAVLLPKQKAVPLLKNLLNDHALVSFHAIASLAHHDHQAAWLALEPKLKNIPESCVVPAARSMGLIANDKAINTLQKLVSEGGLSSQIMQGLKGLQNPSLPGLYIELMSLSKNPISLADAWKELQLFDRAIVVAACQKALQSGNEKKIQTMASLITSHLQEAKLSDSLRAVIEKTKDLETLNVGLSALSCVKTKDYRDVFSAHLSHEKPNIRVTAIRCLAECQNINLYKTLKTVLNDSDSKVRTIALQALQMDESDIVPEEGYAKYYESSLLSKDNKTRKEAVKALTAKVRHHNAKACLKLMLEMQELYGVEESKPLMQVIFRNIPEEQSSKILKSFGYITDWYVIGEFPLGWGSPVKKGAPVPNAFSPEKKVELNRTLKVKYNDKADTRFNKNIVEVDVNWVKATVGNADGLLYMVKGGRAQLQTPHKHGVSYAYTEIMLTEEKKVNLEMVVHKGAGNQIWLNGVLLTLKATLDKNKVTFNKEKQVTLKPGKNTVLVKVWSNDKAPIWWEQKISRRTFSLSLRDLEKKPIQWSSK